jgi:cytochrome P450
MAAGTIPGPAGLPGVGGRINGVRVARDPMVALHRLYQQYGPVASVARGHTRMVCVFSPDLNRQVLGAAEGFNTIDSSSFPVRLPKGSAIERMWDNGLLQQNGPRHKQQRRLMQPAFHKTRIDAYRDDIVAQVEGMLARWRVGEGRDLLLEMKQLTLGVAIKCLLGLAPDRRGERLRVLLERWVDTGFSIPALLLPLNLPGLPFHRSVRMAERLERAIGPLITQKRRSGTDGGDALSMLIRAHDEDGSRLTDAEVVGQAGTLFVAGYITTASALTWTLFLLAQHPRVLADLTDELAGTLRGAAPTVGQLARLPLLDGVIKESLRLLPPIPWSARIAAMPVELGGYAVPQGAMVIWSAAVTHRIPDLYPDPQRFRPDRWATINPSSYEYLPFSAGPRRCLGAEFALLEMRLVLATLLQRFRVALPPAPRVDRAGFFFIFPKGGLPVRLLPPTAPVPPAPVRGNIHAVVDLARET